MLQTIDEECINTNGDPHTTAKANPFIEFCARNITQCWRYRPAMFLRIRNFGLVAALITIVYFLLQSFHVSPHEIEHTTRQSLQVISHYTTHSWRKHVPRITKVTAVSGEENELYEAAIRSHAKHNELNGYEMRVLREKVVDGYWTKATYLLSLMVEELAKPEGQRTEWLVWFGPDVVLLNPYIPLETFLPPKDLDHNLVLATHDTDGFNSGVFLLRVDPWTVRLLIDVISTPENDPKIREATNEDEKAFELVLASDTFREGVLYQPRLWYNAQQMQAGSSEGKPGDLAVHFHDLGGDKWSAMAHTLSQTAERNNAWEMPFRYTTYEAEVREYWDRLRTAHKLLEQAHSRQKEKPVEEAYRRLQYALTYEADVAGVMDHAIKNMKDALG